MPDIVSQDDPNPNPNHYFHFSNVVLFTETPIDFVLRQPSTAVRLHSISKYIVRQSMN